MIAQTSRAEASRIRQWHQRFDGRYYWRPGPLSLKEWSIAAYNTPPPPGPRKHIAASDGTLFNPRLYKVTLEDFAYIWDVNRYLHIPTRLLFTGRQINQRIFAHDCWPQLATLTKTIQGNGVCLSLPNGSPKTIWPSHFIRRYARLSTIADLKGTA